MEIESKIEEDISTRLDKEKIKKLKAYSKSLDVLAKTKSKDIFPNQDYQHAAIVLSKILEYSDMKFLLYDDDLKGDIVNNQDVVSFKHSVIEFISKGGKLSFVIDKKTDNDDPLLVRFLALLKKAFPNQVKIKLASIAFKESFFKLFNGHVNFAVGDKNKFRIEYLDNCLQERTANAICSFNNEEVSTIISEHFYRNIHSCNEYF